MQQYDDDDDNKVMQWFIDPKAAASNSVFMGVISLVGIIALIVFLSVM